jgi:iron complex outermembrane receptor protein
MDDRGRPRRNRLGLAVVSLVVCGITAGQAAANVGTARFSVQGTVTDRTGAPVEGAGIAVDGATEAVSGANGGFVLGLPAGTHVIEVHHPAYRPFRRALTVDRDLSGFQIELSPPMSVSEAITVTAIRAGEEAPVTKTNLGRQEIEELSYGQDVPELLQYTPSVTWYSDSGIGANYSYLTLRGIQQTRINMTFDGAPLNDPAEHALYFNNFHDFTSVVDSIQVQRGVGTSTVGSPSFGGSVNFASVPLSQSSQTEARLAFGSYDTLRASAAYQTGTLGDGFAVGGRVSYARTDGYREHSGTEHVTLFVNGEWRGQKSTLKLVSFSGREKSQLAFLAVDPDTLRDNPRFNPLDDQERDDFGQDFAQLQYTRAVGDDTVVTASIYYNGAAGWFRLWDDPVAQDAMLDYGIDQYFIGSMVTASTTAARISATVGVHYNDFRGDHTLDVGDRRIYRNTGFKKTANAFGKVGYRLGEWLLFGDAQLRWAAFEYDGDIELGSVDWTFFDPKIGARWFLSPRLSCYASIGRAQREPTRLDMLAGEDNATVPHDLEAVEPEKVVDLELGVNYSSQRLALQASLYAMEFDNEIALTGELSEVGLPLRRNVDESYRRGLEIDLRWLVGRDWVITNSSTLSRNRIGEWTQYVDVFDERGSWIGSEPIVAHDVSPLLTPELIINQGVEWSPGNASLALTGRYVDSSHLDNTGNDVLVAPAYFSLDLRASLTPGRRRSAAWPTVAVYVTNLLDTADQYPGGYGWQFITRNETGGETLGGIPYYYPLATRNFVVTLDFKL